MVIIIALNICSWKYNLSFFMIDLYYTYKEIYVANFLIMYYEFLFKKLFVRIFNVLISKFRINFKINLLVL